MTTPVRRPRRRPKAAPTARTAPTDAPAATARTAAIHAPTAPAGPDAQSFAELPLHPALARTLTDHGLTVPSPIQARSIADAVAGRDLLGRARTGSGKTLAFGLPMLTRLAGRRATARRPLALVLVPTRELAAQVGDALAPYAKAVGLRSVTVVGGLSLGRQSDQLRAGAEILIATPGRLIDLLERGACRLDEVGITVLDEADQMADMGFLPQVTSLLSATAPDGQRMLFSATLDGDVDRLVRRFLKNPARHSVETPAVAAATMQHHLLHIDAADKDTATAHIGARDGRVIMFVKTKHRADRVARRLLASGVTAAALHGGKSQPQRTRILDQFRSGAVNALIATDLAARGIHIDDLDLVVNIDPPTDAKDYLHRGGRTARAGRSGTVVTLVADHERRDAARLLAAAGVSARTTAVRPHDHELSRITGARTPSGTPAELPAAPARQAAEAETPGTRRTRSPRRRHR
ncbi:DEAD/DEAH box helicase [Catellatospora sp. TT07R-123]|uniref:DEAD/DEAH box helicase n=1 Tax=Catellatospora sp. TT07R-123 TaxID=2733863 RepID=UPI001B044218|nr:DEAD/DEAH box helicase [Catellatospora sp. TT07R-123]GHJ47667.1 DEAD/DEAH box helicase [Catellatospora sp. TT07R-123]